MRTLKRKKRVAIYDGTFSPIHYGHLICAEKMHTEFDLDMVEMAVKAKPPNKLKGVLDAEDRYELTVAATEDHPHIRASRVDLDRGGSGYSFLTVQAIKNQYACPTELFYLTSAEYLDPENQWFIGEWVGLKELAQLCNLLIFPRDKQDINQLREWRKLVPSIGIEIASVPSPPLSSTLIRDLVKAGRSIRYTTPGPVQQIIDKREHYREPETPQPRRNPVPASEIKRVAIYCSQFDPIHYGHLLFAEWVRQEYDDDRVVFVPSRNPEYNTRAAETAETRYRQVVSATADNPFFEASRIDIARNTNSYAVLTVDDIRRQYGPKVELDYIVSSDYLKPDHPWYLPNWVGADAVMKSVRFLVRPEDMSKVDEVKALARKLPQARIEVVYAPTLPVNSEEIRELAAAGKSLQFMTPFSVQQSISKTGIYKPATSRKRRAR